VYSANGGPVSPVGPDGIRDELLRVSTTSEYCHLMATDDNDGEEGNASEMSSRW